MSVIEVAKPLGGYIELQLSSGRAYYPSLIKLNTARSCLEYILQVNRYSVIYVPYYTCEVILDPIKKLGTKFKFYKIDNQLNPIIDFQVGASECLLYTNYFGLKDETIKTLKNQIDNLIVDNAQAFFSKPLPHLDTFYSCRKFFGVPDGAYLQINTPARLQLEKDVSVDRFSHLIKRIDLGAEYGYQDFITNDRDLLNCDIKEMSALSLRILESIDYDDCKNRRNANFNHLHSLLAAYNELSIDSDSINGPMAYPFLFSRKGLKQELIKNQVFIPTYWPGVFALTNAGMFEYHLSECLLALPIDHRYNINDMNRLTDILMKLL